MRLLILACIPLALAACHKPQQPEENASAAAAEAGPVKGVDRSHKGTAAPAVAFTDPDGNETSLKAFAGKPTLVNLWASWCAPCVKELPTLDRLSQSAAGKLNVVAISQDMGPHASVEAFLQANRIANLDAFQDSKMALSEGLDAEVLPTSILYDASGRELWRFVGDLDWTGPEAAKLLAEAAAKGAG